MDGGIPAPHVKNDAGEWDPAHSFFEGETPDLRATDQGWPTFLKAHSELDGFTSGPGVNRAGDTFPLRWHYRRTEDVPCEKLYEALTIAYERNDRKPVTHLQIGQALWGHDALAVDTGRFCGVLYHAAKRGEVKRFTDTKPARFAPLLG